MLIASFNNQAVLGLYISSFKEHVTGTKLAYLQAQYKLSYNCEHSNTANDFNRSNEKGQHNMKILRHDQLLI